MSKKVEIMIDNGVVEITNAPDDIDIIITDLDSNEQDYYRGMDFWQRLDLSETNYDQSKEKP